MKIVWSSVDNVDKYEIYRAEDNINYTLIATVNSTATSYTDTDAIVNQMNYYKIITVKKVNNIFYKSTYSNELKIVRVTGTSITEISNISTGISLTWDKVEGATGYYIYRKINDNEYSSIETIWGSENTSYIDTDAYQGNRHYYKIIVFKSSEFETYESKESNIAECVRVEATSITELKNVSDGINITWEKNSVANDYYIYRSIDGGDYSYLSNTGDVVTYTDTKATDAGKLYSYKVLTVLVIDGIPFEGWYSEAMSCDRDRAPATSISAVTNVASGVNLTWKKVVSATGYYIYRSVNGGSYICIKNITSNTTLSYTDTGATTNGAKYSYKIITYKTVSGEEYKSAYSGAKICYRLTAPTVSSVSNASTKAITVKWNKNASATGYYIYRSVNGGSYNYIKKITSNATVSYTDSGATTNGAKYSYKIIAYKTVSGATYKSVYSGAKTYYKLTTPTISGATNVKTKAISVKWNKNTSATGYQIKYVVGSTTKTVKVKGASTVTKKISSLTKGKTYKVYVRSYKTVSGVTYYSAYSAAKSVKISK